MGIVVGCLTLTKLGDYYGRRPLYLVGLAMNFVLVSLLMFSEQPVLTTICLFGLGLSITARYYVGYTFTVEMNPKA
jgi:MFS family permease